MIRLHYAAPGLGALGQYLLRNRALWSICVGYAIFACVNGQGGIVNRILSHPLWQPLSRLSFNVYLVQLGLIEVMYGNKKITWYYSLFSQVIMKSAFKIKSIIDQRCFEICTDFYSFINLHIFRCKIFSRCWPSPVSLQRSYH